MQNNSDKDILDLIGIPEKKEQGFKLLVEKYDKRIYWHIRGILIDHEDANDVCQNVFIKIWQKIDSFRGDSSVFSWIYRIATNESINFIRKNRKYKIVSIDSSEEYLLSKIKQSPELSADEIQKKLFTAVAKLPEKQRLIFGMKYFQDLKYEEISEILDQTVGGLKASYHHAVKKIEEFLKND